MRRRTTCVAVLLCVTVVAGPAASARLDRRPMDAASAYLLRWHPHALASARMELLQTSHARITGSIPALDIIRADVPHDRVNALRHSSLVAWVSREGSIDILRAPNDPLLTYQWGVHKIRLLRAWRNELGTRTAVTVGVVDTGVDLSHPDLAGRFVGGADFDQLDSDPSDPNGHGTHVSGVVAANAGNRAGIAGISWGAKIMPLRACDQRGACSDYSVVASLAHAITSGARVVNLSLGGPDDECRAPYAAAAALAEARGVLLVASAGNSGDGDNPRIYPAACPGYFGVGATNVNDKRAKFSSFGNWVDVTAPGETILSTLPPEDRRVFFPGYGFASGTSMAAPHVAGIAALLFSLHPQWTPAHVARRIKQTSVDLGPPGRDPRYGAGRVDALAAVGRPGRIKGRRGGPAVRSAAHGHATPR